MVSKAQEEITRDREVADLVAVMGTPEGRRFVWKILSDGNIFSLSFNANFGVMGFNDGKKSVALGVYMDIHRYCFDLYQEMEREARTIALRLQLTEESGDDNDDRNDD